jgi:hypothetical protein
MKGGDVSFSLFAVSFGVGRRGSQSEVGVHDELLKKDFVLFL